MMTSRFKNIGLVLALVFSSVLASAQVTPIPCEPKMGKDSAETEQYLMVFNTYYQQKQYAEAFPYWYWLVLNAPCAQDRILKNGDYIIRKKLRNIKEKEGKEAMYARIKGGLADTMYMVHQMNMDVYGRVGYITGKLANDMARYTPARRPEAMQLFRKSIALDGNDSRDKVVSDYVYHAVKSNKRDSVKYSLDSILAVLDEVNPIVDFNVAKYTAPGLSKKDSMKGVYWLEAQDGITKLTLPYLDCDRITQMKQPMFNEKSNDVEWLKSTLKLLGKGRCESSPFYLECSEKLFTLEPTPDAAIALARGFKRQGQEAKSKEYYLKAADLATDDQMKYDIFIRLAKKAKNEKSYKDVREFARKALATNPNSGEAYILIGDAYQYSASSCGSGKLKASGVYLAAADKYIKAKSVDPSVADAASQKLNSVTRRFPDKQEAFFLGINEGDSYNVGCWIGETTRVRTIGG